jgi:hypothetical protein
VGQVKAVTVRSDQAHRLQGVLAALGRAVEAEE